MSLVQMRVLRPYPRGGQTHPAGVTLYVSEAAAGHMASAQPPFGERTGAEMDERSFATAAAIAAAAASGVSLEGRAGEGSGTGGRITKADVQRWSAGG